MKYSLHVDATLLKKMHELFPMEAGTSTTKIFKQKITLQYMIMEYLGIIRFVTLDTEPRRLKKRRNWKHRELRHCDAPGAVHRTFVIE